MIGSNNVFAFVQDGKPTCTITTGSANEDKEMGELLQEKVKEITGINLKIVNWRQESSDEKQVFLGTPYSHPKVRQILRDAEILVDPKDKEIKRQKRLLTPEDIDSQSFIIYKSSDDASLVLSGRTSQGVYYALTTIINRLCLRDKNLVVADLGTELMPIINEPAFEYRSIATNIGGPDWLGYQQWEKEWGYDYKGFIDWLAGHKINHLNIWLFNLAFGIAYDSRKFPECVNRHHPNVKREFIKDMIDYAHKRYVKVFFFIDFPDNWTAIIKAHPELAGKNIDVSQIPLGTKWLDYQKRGDIGGESFRKKSWVCASNPKVMQFWEDYWNELLTRYPDVDGIGGQFCEHPNTRCNCDNCQQNFFQLQFEYFTKMTEIGKSKNPDIKVWFYDAWGARDILKNKDKFSNIIYIDWGAGFESFMFGHRLPRSDWYLYHRSSNEFGGEFGIKQCAQKFNKRNLKGFQMRVVHYKEVDQVYQALEEFTWNPYLSIEDFAHFYVIKKLRKEDKTLTTLYSSWIKAHAYKEILACAESRLPIISLSTKEKYKKALEEELKNISKLAPLKQLIGSNKL